ncbi:rRNA maturation RNase YbeY [Coxiella endosymbiont of Rhipicephalus microplus]|uniref:rRNA maturation RNase YbeY n=1 Tax=Coxiella endosymbiont of Rhipicephalus microplus TaxID=1656186 RepID=UPI000C80A2BC|nr:rRNA maturation RNase YbeY [Coxiella endosymbiont of Rhipicephalus microplus]PMB54266.1 Metal-dependent hydrolase YbeY, involved in rRNA and/or ribosome maturation and assembly [Coxiella-like endosymbiont]
MKNKRRKLYIEVQNSTQFSSLPTFLQLQKWVNTTFQFVPVMLNKNLSELIIRFIDREESRELNETYRHQKGPTNILSFSEDTILGLPVNSLGDLAICAPIVAEEAESQNKSLEAHFSHLVIHGVLHLLGYDHIETQEAAKMEELEINILSQLGYKDPYKDW